jgi:transposase
VVKGEAGREALDAWTSWASRCRIPTFVELQRKLVRHRAAIDAALDHGLSQGLIASTNTKIRLLTRIAFGFRSPEALIALAMLALGGHRADLPGRNRPTEAAREPMIFWRALTPQDDRPTSPGSAVVIAERR